MQDMGEILSRIRKLSDKDLIMVFFVVETEINIREAARIFDGLKQLVKESEEHAESTRSPLVLVDSASGKMGGGQTP